MPNVKGSKLKPSLKLSREQVNNLISKLRTQHDKVLFMVQYLTASRISEALSVTKQDFYTTVIDKHKFLVISMKVLKRRRVVYKEPIIPHDDIFVPQILQYINNMKSKDKLFNISKNVAWHRLNRADSRIRTHTFRRSRLWELRTRYGFDAYQLQKFVEAARLDFSTPYIAPEQEEIVKKLSLVPTND